MKTLTKIAATAVLSLAAVTSHANETAMIAVSCSAAFAVKSDEVRSFNPSLAAQYENYSRRFMNTLRAEVVSGRFDGSQLPSLGRLAVARVQPGGPDRAKLDGILQGCSLYL